MKSFWKGTNQMGALLLLLSLWSIYNVGAQSSSFYRHEYYEPISHSPRHFFRRSTGFSPITFTRDLIPEESKHKISTKKYSKPIPNRTSYASDEEDISLEHFNSGEYSNESSFPNSAEQDSREYNIGTHIHVQHPITKTKKVNSSHAKPTKHSLSNVHLTNKGSTSSELHLADVPTASPPKRRPHKFNHVYEPDPFHVIPPPKTTSQAIISGSSNGYNVYETDYEEYKPAKKTRDRFNTIASKKQIEAYLEDQQKKIVDEVLRAQIYNNPEFKQFLKQKEKQRYEKEHRQLYNEEDGIISPPNPPPSGFLENLEEGITFTTARPRRRPSDFKLFPKRPQPVGTIKPKRKFRSAIVIGV